MNELNENENEGGFSFFLMLLEKLNTQISEILLFDNVVCLFNLQPLKVYFHEEFVYILL